MYNIPQKEVYFTGIRRTVTSADALCEYACPQHGYLQRVCLFAQRSAQRYGNGDDDNDDDHDDHYNNDESGRVKSCPTYNGYQQAEQSAVLSESRLEAQVSYALKTR